MKLEPNDLYLFARVAEEGSFSRAAEFLDIPKSTLSRRMAALEAQLGERLLLRTTRKLTITDFGRAVLSHAQQVSSEVEATLALSQHRQAQPSGRLRVSMPGDIANDLLGIFITEFVAKYPAIQLEVDSSPRRVDLIGENFDVAIRMGDLTDDSSLTARRMAVFNTGIYASPAYLARRGVPSEPEALMEHDALHLLTRHGVPAPWTLKRGEARWQGIPPGRARANSPTLLITLALAGIGIASLPDNFADPYVKSGRLVPILEDWDLPKINAWAVFPGRRLMPARTRVFLDALEERLSGKECQQAAAKLEQSKLERRSVNK